MAKRSLLITVFAVSALASVPNTEAVAGDVNVGVHIGIPVPPPPKIALPAPPAVVAVPNTTVSDRKSTRLNSSHVSISYAVFCLKKKIHVIVWRYLLSHSLRHRPAPSALYTLSLHDALPISRYQHSPRSRTPRPSLVM